MFHLDDDSEASIWFWHGNSHQGAQYPYPLDEDKFNKDLLMLWVQKLNKEMTMKIFFEEAQKLHQ